MHAEPSRTGPALAAPLLLAALAAELVDELAGGAQSAAMPLIRDSLSLSYAQVGLLAAAPLILGSLIELPLGMVAGAGRRRRRFVLGGGLAFIAALAAAAVAPGLAALLAAFVLFYPASGAFVGLTQADLMDAEPGRGEQLMARWTVAGAAGAVAGPLLLSAVTAAGGSWRAAYLLLAVTAAGAWLLMAGRGRTVPAGPPDRAPSEPDGLAAGFRRVLAVMGRAAGAMRRVPAGVRQGLDAARQPGVLRWLLLLQVADLLLDVFGGFVALYLVAAAHVTPGRAALAVAARMAGDLVGSAMLVPWLERAPGRVVLAATSVAAGALLPAFLLVPGFWAKLGLLVALSLATAAWYPLLQARLYASLPGRSGTVVSLLSAASLMGGLGPLAIGVLAGQLGLGRALAVLVIVPPCILLGALAVPRGGCDTE